MAGYPSEGYFFYPKLARARLTGERLRRFSVKLGAYALLGVIVARMADLRRLGFDGGAVLGDYWWFRMTHSSS